MPFTSAYRPNLALATLRGCLQRDGFECDLLYAKLDFARRVGLDAYTRIAETLPNQYLAGDFIFNIEPGDAQDDRSTVADYCSLLRTHYPDRVPAWLADELYRQRQAARHALDQWTERILGAAYDLVGVSLTFQLAPGLALARRLHAADGGPLTIAGGGYCEGAPGLVLHRHYPCLDFVARGEGERLLPQLAQQLSRAPRDRDFAAIPGLVWRDGPASVANGARAPGVTRLDDLPMPDYRDWLDQVSAARLPLDVDDLLLSFETSRGCWFGQHSHCTFCGLNGDSMVFRSKSPARVLAELDHLDQYAVPNAEAADLILDMRYFDDPLPALARRPRRMTLFYETKANLKRRHLRLLAQAGVRCIQPGIESLSLPLLRLMRKGSAPYHNVRLLKWCMAFGIQVQWNILSDIPGEDTIEYLHMAGLVPCLVHLAPPMHGLTPVLLNRFSPLYEQADQLGVTGIHPAPAYRFLFGGTVADAGAIAYFFDHDPVPGSATGIAALQRAVREWQQQAGKAFFISIDHGDRIELVDTRPVAGQKYSVLSGCERAVFLACDDGRTRAELRRTLPYSAHRVDAALDALCDKQQVVDLYGHCVSLAVPADDWLPESLPAALKTAAAEALTLQRSPVPPA